MKVEEKKQSPDYVRISMASSITLGFVAGSFYRCAKLGCINLLLTYNSGCGARCSYCGLSGTNTQLNYEKRNFIRVKWDVYPLDEVVERIPGANSKGQSIRRICVSMITRKRAVTDTIKIIDRISSSIDIPISVLASPTVLKKKDVEMMKSQCCDMFGVALDCATEELFEYHRGAGVKGPHKWHLYWKCIKEAVEIFGRGNVSVHLIAGIGETDKQFLETVQRIYQMGAVAHLFSFYPEAGSILADKPPCSVERFRRMQLARYLIHSGVATFDDFGFSRDGQIVDYGVGMESLMTIISTGEPFMTSGCPGRDGVVACNRPYGSYRPGMEFRDYPFLPLKDDIEKIKQQIGIHF